MADAVIDEQSTEGSHETREGAPKTLTACDLLASRSVCVPHFPPRLEPFEWSGAVSETCLRLSVPLRGPTAQIYLSYLIIGIGSILPARIR